jgi:hypothetical protein
MNHGVTIPQVAGASEPEADAAVQLGCELPL